ncbi:hypothetical protein RZS08_22005, partial [Arthrospira platensis SPKY1]|nr:hypothetical protein [Arthrospira platensis SPKY1]
MTTTLEGSNVNYPGLLSGERQGGHQPCTGLCEARAKLVRGSPPPNGGYMLALALQQMQASVSTA